LENIRTKVLTNAVSPELAKSDRFRERDRDTWNES